jgi:predicted mannosyl-3-phosphoglycerate phosphatase (HAD superfamily)
MALTFQSDEFGNNVADQVMPLETAELDALDLKHTNLSLLLPRIRETARDREEAIGLLEQAAEAVDLRDAEISDLREERDALAARVLELEQKAAPQS